MSESPFQTDPAPQRPWRPQFGLRGLLAAMALLSVMAASLGGLLRGEPQGLLIAVGAPLGLMVAISIYAAVARFFRR